MHNVIELIGNIFGNMKSIRHAACMPSKPVTEKQQTGRESQDRKYFFVEIVLILALNFVVSGAYSQSDLYGYTQKNFRKATVFNETIDLDNIDVKRINAVIFYLTNEVRIKKGFSELNYHPKLEQMAQLHSNRMVKYNFFNHTDTLSKNLQNPNDRARFVGINNPYMAENIVQSFVLRYQAGDKVYTGNKGQFRNTPNGRLIEPHTYLSLGEVLIDSWMNSPPHKANILSKKAVALGCGTTFYLRKDFNDMPSVIATQNFQLYETIQVEH